MAKKSSKLGLKSSSQFSFNQVLLFCLIFGLIGGIIGWAVFAAPAPLGKGTISFATVNGAPYTSSTVFKLGDTLTFNTTVPKLAGWQYPMIVVSCYQDVNGDGTVNTSLLGTDIVYSWVDHTGTTFSFSGQGQSSIWTNRGGGPAKCRVELDAYGWKSGHESIINLATIPDFDVAG